jgi:nucleoside phosphorylase
MKKILLVVAHPWYETPKSFQSNLFENLFVTGVGAYAALFKLNSYLSVVRPDFIVTVGHCGGANDNVSAGDVIVVDSLRSNDEKLKKFGVVELDLGKEKEIRDRVVSDLVARFVGEDWNCYSGQIESFSRKLVTQRSEIHSNAIAVELEMYSIVLLAKRYSIPFFGAKIVSDIVPVVPCSFEEQIEKIRSNVKATQPVIDTVWKVVRKIIQDS